MTDRAFLDTNVLVYSVDTGDQVRQTRALALLGDPAYDFVLSAQVLGEFYVVVTRKLSQPLDHELAAEQVIQLSKLPTVPIDGDLAKNAVRSSRRWTISYWDALILEAARASMCSVILSEDLSARATYDGITIRNPFA